jgi:hypothetical protein
MMVRDIYESIVNADWFNRNAITERELFVSIVGRVRRELPQMFWKNVVQRHWSAFRSEQNSATSRYR